MSSTHDDNIEKLKQLAESCNSSIAVAHEDVFASHPKLINLLEAYSRVKETSDRLVGLGVVQDVFEATRASSEVISPENLSGPSILSYHDVRHIGYEELRKATEYFKYLILGDGIFHTRAYKGWIDEQTLIASKPGFGMPVVVKLWVDRERREDWLKEIHLLSQLRHPNLSKLVGHCSEKDKTFMLVYEFMPKESLDKHLFGRGHHETLSWATRIKVAIDVATALSFLHDKDKPVVHRHVKSCHVLLDGEFNAKLCSFGSATEMNNVSNRVKRSYGYYAAPEYIDTGYFTTKCDVYSFGIVVLELLSGKPSINKNLLNWAKPYLMDKTTMLLVMDSKLEGQYSSKEVHKVANVAVQCLSRDPTKRPNMAEVLIALKKVQKKKLFPW